MAQHIAWLLVYPATTSEFARVMVDVGPVTRADSEASLRYQFVYELGMVDYPDSVELVPLLEDAVAYRAGEQQGAGSGTADDFRVLHYHLHGLLDASCHPHGPSAADASVLVHEFVLYSCLAQQRLHGLPDRGGQSSHAPGIIEHLAAAVRGQRSRVDGGIVGVYAIAAHRPLGYAQPVALDAHGADGGAFAAEQAFVAYLLYAPFVVPAYLPVQVHGRVSGVGLLHAHGAGVDAESAARAGIYLGLREALARVAYLEPCVAHGNQEYLRGDVHVAGERQHHEEDAEGAGVGPPAGEDVRGVAQERREQVVEGLREEGAAADVGGESFGEKAEREYRPQRIQAYHVEEARPGGAAHAEQPRAYSLDYREGDAAEDHEKEEVHQEEEHGAFHRAFGLGHEISEEYRVVEQLRPVRRVEQHLDVSDDYQHEPAEGYAGVHVAQELVALPYLHVQKAVAEDVLDVLQHGLRGDQGFQEAPPVLGGQLQKYSCQRDEAVCDDERHPYQERQHEVVVAGRKSFAHLSPPYTVCRLRVSDAGC